MKRHAAYAVSAAVVLALATALVGQAHAACGSGQRVSHRDAECLRAKWDNNTLPTPNTVEAQNLCSDYGTVVAKIDSKGRPDDTWSLTDGETRKSARLYRTDWVYCCRDLSDLCNKSDIVNADSCLDQFLASPASETCSRTHARVAGSDECMIVTECKPFKPIAGAPPPESIITSITASWSDTANIHNCGGLLRVGACLRPGVGGLPSLPD